MMIRIAQHPALLVFLFTLVSIRGAVFQESGASPPSQAEAEEPSVERVEEEVEDTDSANGAQQSPNSTADSGRRSGTRLGGLIEDVSVPEVKRFLDPTQMINRLDAFLQYNSRSQQVSSNIRFGWTTTSGTGLYVVFNDRYAIPGERFDPLERALFVKYSYQLDLF